MNKSRKVFIAGALSGVSGVVRLETLYENIGELCEKKGYQTFVPSRDCNIKLNPNIKAREVYDLNIKELSESNLLIAYVSEPSTGVGMEIQKATSLGINVIILSEKGSPISIMLLGCPSVVNHIRFENFEDALDKLDKAVVDLNQVISVKQGL